MDILSEKGPEDMSISGLSRNLGVTKGSFYWHFKDRNDFVRSLLDYWMRSYTMNIIDDISAVEGSAKKRLLVLMQLVNKSGAARFDLAVRAWAALEPGLDGLVQKVDAQRLSYVRELFREIGFRGAELEMRTQTFVVYYSFEQSFSPELDQAGEEYQKTLKLRHAFFTRK